MKKIFYQFIFMILCCIFLLFLLLNSHECIELASNGLLIWYQNMIPSLFPFMVLSGFLIRSGLSVKIGNLLTPILGTLFQLPAQMLYAIFMGFLCGFPMGAKMVADMLENHQITDKQGEFLLSFCNNIGPLYMLGYVVPLFNYQNSWYLLGWMYFVPLSYGLILRYTIYRKFFPKLKHHENILNYSQNNTTKYETKYSSLKICSYNAYDAPNTNYIQCFQHALTSAIEQITMLGGCMVFFNCMLIFPQILENYFTLQNNTNLLTSLVPPILKSLVEIGGGLQQLKILTLSTNYNLVSYFFPLIFITFGGLSCIAQTCFILKNTGLKISTYIKHKLLQSCIYIMLIMIAYLL